MTRSSRGAWLAGALIGVMAGVLAVELVVVGWLLFVAFAIPAVLVGPRLAALGGLFAGSGSVVVAVLRLAVTNCEAFDRGPGQGCTSPDLGPWFVAASGMIGVGFVLTVAAVIRSRRNARR